MVAAWFLPKPPHPPRSSLSARSSRTPPGCLLLLYLSTRRKRLCAVRLWASRAADRTRSGPNCEGGLRHRTTAHHHLSPHSLSSRCLLYCFAAIRRRSLGGALSSCWTRIASSIDLSCAFFFAFFFLFPRFLFFSFFFSVISGCSLARAFQLETGKRQRTLISNGPRPCATPLRSLHATMAVFISLVLSVSFFFLFRLAVTFPLHIFFLFHYLPGCTSPSRHRRYTVPLAVRSGSSPRFELGLPERNSPPRRYSTGSTALLSIRPTSHDHLFTPVHSLRLGTSFLRPATEPAWGHGAAARTESEERENLRWLNETSPSFLAKA